MNISKYQTYFNSDIEIPGEKSRECETTENIKEKLKLFHHTPRRRLD
jgi:hypothetical protein